MMYEVVVQEIEMRRESWSTVIFSVIEDRPGNPRRGIALPMSHEDAKTFMLGDKHTITVNG